VVSIDQVLSPMRATESTNSHNVQLDMEASRMVITILEAHVTPDNVAALEAAYSQGIEQLDAGITETFLVRASKDTHLWRIITVWESRTALEAMRQSGQTPRGVVMFHAAQAEPELSIFEVVAQGIASA
jgi:quinol monooxygenase YgiN